MYFSVYAYVLSFVSMLSILCNMMSSGSGQYHTLVVFCTESSVL